MHSMTKQRQPWCFGASPLVLGAWFLALSSVTTVTLANESAKWHKISVPFHNVSAELQVPIEKFSRLIHIVLSANSNQRSEARGENSTA
jgi:hypothetical protein